MASRWRHCADLTGPGIEPQTSRTDSVRLATELIRSWVKQNTQNWVKIGIYNHYCSPISIEGAVS